MSFDVSALRRQFPFLEGTPPPVYLDTAATCQQPGSVIETMHRFFASPHGSVHRGVHRWTEESTVGYEAARTAVQQFLHARFAEEIVFVRNTTEAINLVARSLGSTFIQGDCVVLSHLEHHSNIVPWLQLKEERGIGIRWMPIDRAGHIDPADLAQILKTERVKLIAITGQSNVLGVRPDLPAIISLAHAAGALVLVDAAQLAGHAPMDVEALDCDFLAFSGHKVYGPTGIGVLYGKRDLLQAMPPFLGGGMMIKEVTETGFTPADLPAKFEAGTPAIAEALGLHAALDWLMQYSWEERCAWEQTLLAHALKQLATIKGLTLLGPAHAPQISGCISFTLEGIHPHDLTDLLGQEGFALRAGHHCAQPLHTRLGIPASTRLSLGLYTTPEEIDALLPAIEQVRRTLL